MADEEFKVSFSTLKRGELFAIKSIEKTEGVFNGRKTDGLKVTIEDDGLDIVTYLPSKLVKMTSGDKVSQIKAAAETGAKFTVCYYGKMQKELICEFYGRIHAPGEGRNDKLYNDMTKIMAKYCKESSCEKRKGSDNEEASAAKVAKSE